MFNFFFHSSNVLYFFWDWSFVQISFFLTSTLQQKMPKVPSVIVPQLSLKNYIHPIATVLIAWAIAANGFPQPPQLFKNLVQNELFQYFLVFVLVYQGWRKTRHWHEFDGHSWSLSACQNS